MINKNNEAFCEVANNRGLEKGLSRLLRTLFPLMHKSGELFVFNRPYMVREDRDRFLHRNQEPWVHTIEIGNLIKENRDQYAARHNVNGDGFFLHSKELGVSYGMSSSTKVEMNDTIMYLGYEIYRDNYLNEQEEYEYRYITWWLLGEKIIRGYVPKDFVTRAYGGPGTWKQPF